MTRPDLQPLTRSLAKLAATRAEIAGFGHGEAVLAGAHERIATAPDPFVPPAETL